MEIRRIESDLLSSNMYLLVEKGHALVIDPCRDVSAAEGLVTDRILLTHEHYDHISGVNAWKQATGAGVLCSAPCAENIRNPRKNLARYFTAFCQLQTWVKVTSVPEVEENFSCTAEEVFSDETAFDWMGHHFSLFVLPGHSSGSAGILVDQSFFFSGDSLLEDREIETGFPGGDPFKWENISRQRLLSLPENVLVYPGHFREFRLAHRLGCDADGGRKIASLESVTPE